ncbi:MAG: DUF5615 family PIN-like protein [Anaerolineaceae bacterium]|nr:DUF5615 family PIN-like protein [Anaerolineaceae bacterium]
MKFLLDMGLAASTANFLREQGHDAVHLRDRGLQRLHDLDFSRIIALSRSHRPSVITFRLSDMQPSHVNHYLTQVLDRFSTLLDQGALVSVNEQAIRVRPLPIEPA